MKQTVVLIPGVYSKGSESLFEAIGKSLAETYREILVLEKADEEYLESKAVKIKSKILIGKSYGGSLAIKYQIKHKDAEALILLAPYVKLREQYREIKIPVLIVHGTEDQVIPIQNSRELEKLFDNCKLVEIQGADHGYLGKELETAQLVADWVNSLHFNAQ
jgi:pimeloyl-ACP methyl ester carboxylesterase